MCNSRKDTAMFQARRFDVRSTLTSSMIHTLAAIPLCLVAACAVDSSDSETASAEQALAGDCVILRPYGWDNGINVCAEGPIVPSGTPITVPAGWSHEFHTVIPIYGLGTGSVTVVCRADGSGTWDETNRSCFKDIFDP